MRRFFWAPKKYVKTDGLENIDNFTISKSGETEETKKGLNYYLGKVKIDKLMRIDV